MPYITVFTPVYNRAHTLERLYKSLKEQTYRDFEWVIVDDGSHDSSVELIKEFISENNDFSIKLLQRNHGGKHRAVNAGLDIAEGRLFFMLDSDDWIKKDSLEKVISWEKKIPAGSKCAGLCGCMEDEQGNKISKGLKKEYIYMPLTGMIRKGIDGDRADILFTDVFRQYKYPEIEGEYHIAPGVPFIRMANDGYKLLFFNEIIYIAEYGPDGLTAMGDKKSLDNFQGYTLRSKELLRSHIGSKRKLEILVKYSLLSKKKKMSIREESDKLEISLLFVITGRFLGMMYMGLKKLRGNADGN